MESINLLFSWLLLFYCISRSICITTTTSSLLDFISNIIFYLTCLNVSIDFGCVPRPHSALPTPSLHSQLCCPNENSTLPVNQPSSTHKHRPGRIIIRLFNPIHPHQVRPFPWLMVQQKRSTIFVHNHYDRERISYNTI